MTTMTIAQTQCPNCQSYKVQSDSAKRNMAVWGVSLIIWGSVLTITVIGAIIGVPAIFIGLVLLVSCIFVKGTNEKKCRNCKFQFVANQA